MTGGIAVKQFKLKAQLKIFAGIIDDAHAELKNLQTRLNDHNRQFAFNRRKKTPADENFQKQIGKEISVVRSLLFKALCWSANGLYLAGEPARASKNLLEASDLTPSICSCAITANRRPLKPANSPASTTNSLHVSRPLLTAEKNAPPIKKSTSATFRPTSANTLSPTS